MGFHKNVTFNMELINREPMERKALKGAIYTPVGYVTEAARTARTVISLDADDIAMIPVEESSARADRLLFNVGNPKEFRVLFPEIGHF